MENNEVFPVDNWYLEITKDNLKLINKWRNDCFNGRYGLSIDRDAYNAIKHTGWGANLTSLRADSILKEITFDQFKKYVLKQEESIVPEITEDLSYMIDLFKQLKLN